MEKPIQVAVRIYPCVPNELCRVEVVPNNIDSNIKRSDSYVSNDRQSNGDNGGCSLVQVIRSKLGEDNNGNAVDNEKTSFKFRHALPYGCSQEYLYRTTVQPMIHNLLEGYDVSIVTYGQTGTGKTYCMFGPGFDGAYNKLEQGIVPRAIYDIFTQLAKKPSGCLFSVNVSWIDICGNEIRDIFGQVFVQCHSIMDVWQCLRYGFANRNPESNHSIFTITIEQKWVTPDGLIQHRLSTASFCDLAGTQRMAAINQFNEAISVPRDNGLQVLERIVNALSNPNTLDNDRNFLMSQYEETRLTSLLKDSFGGRAQTLMICLVSPLEQDTFETIENLHVAYKAQFIRNAVVLNTFSDNNKPFTDFIDPVHDIEIKSTQYNPACAMNKLNDENVSNAAGMEFANAQWMKLISNAESLFNKLLLNNKTLNDDDRECIEEWMYLKQECESFGSIGLMNPRLLKPIQETDENSDNESGWEGGEQDKTDVSGQNAIFSDNESDDEENFGQIEAKVSELMTKFSHKVNECIEENYHEYIEKCPNGVINSHDDNVEELERKKMDKAIVKVEPSEVAINHRRRSIQTGENSGLSKLNIERLQRISEECMKNNQLSLQNTVCREANAFLDNSDEMHPLRMANRYKAEEDILSEIRIIQNDIEAKKKEISELKQNIKLLDELVESTGEHVKAKRDIDRRVSALQQEKKRCKKLMTNSRDEDEIEKWKTDLKEIDKELKEKLQFKEISRDSENTLRGYQQEMTECQKLLSALKKSLKIDQKSLKDLEGKLKIERTKKAKEEKKSIACVNVDSRITQLNSVLKNKSEYLYKNNDDSETVESIRHEIRNLRDQRDRLTDAQCILNQKLNKKLALTDLEARQIIEYEVAKEVIDHAMEMKNQLICGRDISMKKNFVENPDLMGQLSKLNEKEMRILLYKCFQKIVDLRDSSCQLEKQVILHEHKQREMELNERALYDHFKQYRWKAERYILHLQKQYQSSLTKLLQKAGENCGPSNISSDSLMLPSPLHLVHSKNRHHHTISNEIGFGIHDYRGTSQQQHSYRFTNAALATTSKRDNAEPMELLQKQKPKMNILKLFSSSSGLKRNLQQQQTLMLMAHAHQNARIESKVTVTKNKIIIQQNKS